MKLRNNDISTLFAAYLLLGPIMMVAAERKIKYFFNSTTESCTAEDLDKIDAIFTNPLRNRRQLRATNSRQLQRARRCANDCEGYVRGSCHVSDCLGFRRELQSTTASKFFSCADETNDIDQRLQLLIDKGQVTESCQNFLNPINREVSCYDNVIYGAIEHVRLWNMSASLSNPVLITNDLTDMFPICKSLLFSIEAKVNNCVDFVHFQMDGPRYSRDHTEDDVPYSLFGDSITNQMYSRRLYYTGIYNLTIIPDGLESKKRTLQLNVMKC